MPLFVPANRLGLEDDFVLVALNGTVKVPKGVGLAWVMLGETNWACDEDVGEGVGEAEVDGGRENDEAVNILGTALPLPPKSVDCQRIRMADPTRLKVPIATLRPVSIGFKGPGFKVT